MNIVAGILFFMGISQLRSEEWAMKIVGLAFIAGAIGIVVYKVTHPVVIEVPQFESPGY